MIAPQSHGKNESIRIKPSGKEKEEIESLNRDMELPAAAINDMAKLLLKNVKIVIAEWIPSGPNFINMIAEEMGGFQGREWMYITQKEDMNPFSSRIDDSSLKEEKLSITKTDFLGKQASGKQTVARSVRGGKAQVRVLRCHPTDYAEFEACMFYEELSIQKEAVNIFVDKNGLFVYSAEIKKVKMGEIVAEEWIPVFMLARVIPDLIEDTTPLSEGLLGKYQKDMLNSVFEGFKERNKFVMIIADEIDPVRICEEDRKSACCHDVHELLKEETARKAILELVDMLPDQGIVEIGGKGSGRFMINGTRASILIDPDFSAYKDLLKLPLICKALGFFLKESYAKIWVLWKEITTMGQDTLKKLKRQNRLDINAAIKTQEIIAEHVAKITLINDIINYVLLSCDVIEKQFDLLNKDIGCLPPEDKLDELINEFTFATSIDVLKNRATVQNNLTKNLQDEANGASGLLNTMVNNELIRQTRFTTYIALVLAIGSIIVTLYTISSFSSDVLIIMTEFMAIVAILIVFFIAGRKTLAALHAKKKFQNRPGSNREIKKL
ncbi:MAG TPA: hypothetical protein VKM55_19325 [Candidatus Lokiarchaeia archaeon]|nr:hypothetical protein [Candidatus Lokiarchaeia archaeon]